MHIHIHTYTHTYIHIHIHTHTGRKCNPRLTTTPGETNDVLTSALFIIVWAILC